MNRVYRTIKEKSRGCRDRNIRIKLELFLLALKLGNVSEACARRGFSRRFYYRWWNRFKRSQYHLESLMEYSRRPRRSPRRIPERIEKRILWYRRRQYGARMIEAYLKREGIKVSRSTICHVLRKRRHRPLTRRQKLKAHRKRYELLIPGQRMQMDVKYVPELVDGQRVYCYVIIDECTRWRFARGYLSLNQYSTESFLIDAKRACPFPIHTIQTDNGFEFTFALNPKAKNSKIPHAMDRWCSQNGIRHRLIPPGEKELNGKVERSHRIDEQYFYWRAKTISLAHFNRQLERWIGFYNSQRLHGGIDYVTPIDKLEERFYALKNPPYPALELQLERLRLRFIQEYPKRRSPDDRKIFKLEQELESLLKVA